MIYYILNKKEEEKHKQRMKIKLNKAVKALKEFERYDIRSCKGN